jgi:hypothetical protein
MKAAPMRRSDALIECENFHTPFRGASRGSGSHNQGVVRGVLLGGAIELLEFVELESVVFGAPLLWSAGVAVCDDEEVVESGGVLVLLVLLVLLLWSEDMPEEVDELSSCFAHAASKANVAIPRDKLTRFIKIPFE